MKRPGLIAIVAIVLIGIISVMWLFAPLFEDVSELGGMVAYEGGHPESLNWINRNASVRLGLLKPYAMTLEQASVSDAEFERLDLSRFEVLLLDCPRLTQRSAVTISSFGNIRELLLAMKCVNDDWIFEIGKMGDLRTLTIDGTGITNRSVEALSTMPNLKVLSVKDTSLTSEDITKLLDAPLLESLYVSPDQFSEELRHKCKSRSPEVRLHVIGY